MPQIMARLGTMVQDRVNELKPILREEIRAELTPKLKKEIKDEISGDIETKFTDEKNLINSNIDQLNETIQTEVVKTNELEPKLLQIEESLNDLGATVDDNSETLQQNEAKIESFKEKLKLLQCTSGYVMGDYGECQSCNCNPNGSVGLNCDAHGKCSCSTGYTGAKCTQCESGYSIEQSGQCTSTKVLVATGQ